jgi:hypothetical protein
MIVSLDSVTWLPVGPKAIGAGGTRWLSAEGPPVAVPALDNSSDADVPAILRRCRSARVLARERGGHSLSSRATHVNAPTLASASVSYSGGIKGRHPGRKPHDRGRTAIEVYSELVAVYQDARRV